MSWKMSRRATSVLVAAAGWLSLVLLLVWMKPKTASWWRVLESPVTVVAGGFAAIVAAALLFDPFKQWVASTAAEELEARDDQRWLTDRYPHARATQGKLRHLTALGTALLYEAVASTGALTAVIPSETLRGDVRKLPPDPFKVPAGQGDQWLQDALVATFKALANDLEQEERTRSTGPMAMARFQVDMLATALGVHVEKEQIAELVRIMGPESSRAPNDRVSFPVGPSGPVPDEQWERLNDATVAAVATCPEAALADRLATLASRMLSMGNEVTGVRNFDPTPLKKSLMELVVQAERMRYLVSSPSGRARVSTFGELLDPGTGGPWEEARVRMVMAGRVLDSLMDVRYQLLLATAATLEAASRLGGDTRNAWLDDPSPDDVFATDGSWDMWRRRNHLMFGDAAQATPTE